MAFTYKSGCYLTGKHGRLFGYSDTVLAISWSVCEKILYLSSLGRFVARVLLRILYLCYYWKRDLFSDGMLSNSVLHLTRINAYQQHVL